MSTSFNAQVLDTDKLENGAEVKIKFREVSFQVAAISKIEEGEKHVFGYIPFEVAHIHLKNGQQVPVILASKGTNLREQLKKIGAAELLVPAKRQKVAAQGPKFGG